MKKGVGSVWGLMKGGYDVLRFMWVRYCVVFLGLVCVVVRDERWYVGVKVKFG